MMKETTNNTAATSTSTTTNCEVVAPSDLPTGYQFNATLDGKTIPVTVPPGGVQQGQSFPVMYPKQEETSTTTRHLAPVGRWRNGLFSCCDTAVSRFFVHSTKTKMIVAFLVFG